MLPTTQLSELGDGWNGDTAVDAGRARSGLGDVVLPWRDALLAYLGFWCVVCCVDLPVLLLMSAWARIDVLGWCFCWTATPSTAPPFPTRPHCFLAQRPPGTHKDPSPLLRMPHIRYVEAYIHNCRGSP